MIIDTARDPINGVFPEDYEVVSSSALVTLRGYLHTHFGDGELHQYPYLMLSSQRSLPCASEAGYEVESGYEDESCRSPGGLDDNNEVLQYLEQTELEPRMPRSSITSHEVDTGGSMEE